MPQIYGVWRWSFPTRLRSRWVCQTAVLLVWRTNCSVTCTESVVTTCCHYAGVKCLSSFACPCRRIISVIKPKFHYADFATKSGTSSRQSRGHKSWKSATWFCRGLSWFVSATNPRLCRELVTDFVANISTCRDGLCRRLSPKLHGFMICHRLCPREVSVKVGVMEFGLNQQHGLLVKPAAAAAAAAVWCLCAVCNERTWIRSLTAPTSSLNPAANHRLSACPVPADRLWHRGFGVVVGALPSTSVAAVFRPSAAAAAAAVADDDVCQRPTCDNCLIIVSREASCFFLLVSVFPGSDLVHAVLSEEVSKHLIQSRSERRNRTELNWHGLVFDELTNRQAGRVCWSLVDAYVSIVSSKIKPSQFRLVQFIYVGLYTLLGCYDILLYNYGSATYKARRRVRDRLSRKQRRWQMIGR